jgi:hypothetical protein
MPDATPQTFIGEQKPKPYEKDFNNEEAPRSPEGLDASKPSLSPQAIFTSEAYR